MKKIPNIPRPRDVSADVADLDAKLVSFGTRVSELQAERLAIYARVEASRSEEFVSPQDSRVAALLGVGEVVPSTHERDRLSKIVTELDDLRRATDTAASMRRVALSKASAAICATMAPEYRARVRSVVDALKAAHAASVELHAMTNALEDSEVSWTGLGVAFPTCLGFPNDLSGPLAHYLRDLVHQGHITKSEIPKELQPK
jgi:hypothetical protein